MAEEQDFFSQIDMITPMAVRVAATLRLVDLIADGVSRIEALAQESGSDPDTLSRLPRYLSCRGIFRQTEDGRYALTELSSFLIDDHPFGMRAWLDLEGFGGRMDGALMGLLHSVKTGESAYESVHGKGFYEELEENTALGGSFDSLMMSQVSAVIPNILSHYDWTSTEHVIDVGGGNGTVVAAILEANPKLKGTLVERQGPATRAQSILDDAGVSDRCEIVSGTFFDPLPKGGDIYILSTILHGWSDADAERVLRRCAEAISANSRLLIVESILADDDTRAFVIAMDLRVLVIDGGRERTLDEFRSLLAVSGLGIKQVYSLSVFSRSIIECVHAP